MGIGQSPSARLCWCVHGYRFFSSSSAPYPNKHRVSCLPDFFRSLLFLLRLLRYRNMLSINKFGFFFVSLAKTADFSFMLNCDLWFRSKRGNSEALRRHKCVVGYFEVRRYVDSQRSFNCASSSTTPHDNEIIFGAISTLFQFLDFSWIDGLEGLSIDEQRIEQRGMS